MTGRDPIQPGQRPNISVGRPGEDDPDQGRSHLRRGDRDPDSEAFEKILRGRAGGADDDAVGDKTKAALPNDLPTPPRPATGPGDAKPSAASPERLLETGDLPGGEDAESPGGERAHGSFGARGKSQPSSLPRGTGSILDRGNVPSQEHAGDVSGYEPVSGSTARTSAIGAPIPGPQTETAGDAGPAMAASALGAPVTMGTPPIGRPSGASGPNTGIEPTPGEPAPMGTPPIGRPGATPGPSPASGLMPGEPATMGMPPIGQPAGGPGPSPTTEPASGEPATMGTPPIGQPAGGLGPGPATGPTSGEPTTTGTPPIGQPTDGPGPDPATTSTSGEPTTMGMPPIGRPAGRPELNPAAEPTSGEPEIDNPVPRDPSGRNPGNANPDLSPGVMKGGAAQVPGSVQHAAGGPNTTGADPDVADSGNIPFGIPPRDSKDAKPVTGDDDADVADAAKAASSVSGDHILRGMGAQPAAQPVAPNAPAAADTASSLSEALEKMADQILVSKPGADNTEVRIKLKSSLLEGAELSLQREPGGGLMIKFETSSYAVTQRINEISEQLQQHMEKRSSDPVRIVVDTRTENQNDDQNDGRSRNRRDPWDADAEDNE